MAGEEQAGGSAHSGSAEWAARLRQVSDAALAVNSELDLHRLLQRVVDSARELVQARYAALGVARPDLSGLSEFITSGMAPEQIRAIGPWPRGLGLLGALLRDPRPLRVRKIGDHPQSIGFPPHHPPMSSFLGVPVRLGDRILGNFYLTEKQGAGEFSQEDEDIIVLFASHAAAAVENARRFSETRVRLDQSLLEIQRAERRSRYLAELSTLMPIGPIVEQIPWEKVADGATELLGDGCAIYLVDPEDLDVVRTRVIRHRDPARAEADRRFIEGSWHAIRGQVLGLGHTLFVATVEAPALPRAELDPESMRKERLSAAILVPIRRLQKVYGAFASLGSTPVSFSQEDLTFGSLIADRLGVALENAEVIRQLKAALVSSEQAQAERERLLAELDATLSSVANGLIIYSPTGEIMRMNAAGWEILGYSPAEGGKPLLEQSEAARIETAEGEPIPVEDLPAARALRGEMVQGVILAVHRPQEIRWVAASVGPIRGPEGQLLGAVVNFSDITALHRLQEQQEDLSRTISHDLRTPLTAIQGHAQLLQRFLQQAGADDHARRSADIIVTGTKRMDAMIQDLVELTRLESGQMTLNPVPTNLASFAIDLKARLAPVLDTGRVWVETHEGPATVLADQNRLERIMTNLLSNALKYSEGQVTVRVEPTDRHVKVSVADQGQGIDPEDLRHLFQRFYRAGGTRKTEGLGLGLYITRMLVETMGGHIWAESEPGKGSTFSFTLPAAEG